ncbi:MAG TPA: hypothetical protein PKA64_10120, partial [Myxococcota bacterium]|nr:hypothetical protein [Myxococcota bacterium]
EDYAIAILEHTSLGRAIRANFVCDPVHVAALISGDVRVGDEFFRDGGLDHRRLLSQIISSELDVDRLDYLVRDAYFTGARYGMVDVGWILSHLSAHTAHGQVWLALDRAALYAFEDFLVSRYHMFLQVYFHHTSVVYEEMLKRFVGNGGGGWSIPSDLDAYVHQDDVSLEAHMRACADPWARRIVEHRPFRRVVERHGQGRQVNTEREIAALAAAGVEVIHTESSPRLSRYALGRRSARSVPIFVQERLPGERPGRVSTLTEASSIFDRYADVHSISRVYVSPEDRDRAMALLAALET